MKLNGLKKALVGFLCLSLFGSAAVLPAAAETAAAPKTVEIALSYEQDNCYKILPETTTVSSDLSDQYGYTDTVTDGVSVLDGLIRAHELKLADAFTPQTKDDYLVLSEQGFISKIMGIDTSSIGFLVNGNVPNDGILQEGFNGYAIYTVNQAKIVDGDVLQFFHYNPDGYFGEIYSKFIYDEKDVKTLTVEAGKDITLSLLGYSIVYEGASPDLTWKKIAASQICTLHTEDNTTGTLVPIDNAITDPDGKVTLNFSETGVYRLAVTSDPDNLTFIIPQIITVTVLSAEQIAAGKVEALIDEIGNVTLASEEQIQKVRKAFNDLSDEAKELVQNLDILNAAEEELAALKDAEEKKQAAEVDKIIESIGKVSLDSEESIKKAQDAYDSLSDSAKKKVQNLDILKAAQEQYAHLKELDEQIPQTSCSVDPMFYTVLTGVSLMMIAVLALCKKKYSK